MSAAAGTVVVLSEPTEKMINQENKTLKVFRSRGGCVLLPPSGEWRMESGWSSPTNSVEDWSRIVRREVAVIFSPPLILHSPTEGSLLGVVLSAVVRGEVRVYLDLLDDDFNTVNRVEGDVRVTVKNVDDVKSHFVLTRRGDHVLVVKVKDTTTLKDFMFYFSNIS